MQCRKEREVEKRQHMAIEAWRDVVSGLVPQLQAPAISRGQDIAAAPMGSASMVLEYPQLQPSTGGLAAIPEHGPEPMDVEDVSPGHP